MVYRISVYAYIATNLATKSMSMNKTQFAADEPNKGVGGSIGKLEVLPLCVHSDGSSWFPEQYSHCNTHLDEVY